MIYLRAILSVFLIFSAFHGAADERFRVLVISSYHPAFPTFYHQVDGIKAGLKSMGFDQENLDLDYEYMDSKRFYTQQNLENFAKNIRYKVATLPQPYQLILTTDDNALDYALKAKEDIFDTQPIVFTGVNNIPKAESLIDDPNVTGVVEAVSIEQTLQAISEIHNDSAELTLKVIVDGTQSGQSNLDTLIQTLEHFPDIKPEIISMSSNTYDQLDKRLAANAKAPVLLLSAYHDSNGKRLSFFQAVSRLSRVSSSPIYHLWMHGIGEGLFGGWVVSHYEQGYQAAVIAGRILKGEKAGDIRLVSESPNVAMFDYSLLEKYQVTASNVERLGNIRWVNKPKSFREQNPELFWFSIAAYVFLALVIIALLYFIRLKKQVTNKLERAYEKEQENLKRTYSDLVQSEKMAALGRLVAGVAHEINTPVGVGVTTTSYLQTLIQEMNDQYRAQQLSKKRMESFLDNFIEGTSILMSSLGSADRLISSFKQVAVDQSDEHCREISMKEYIDSVVLSLKPRLKLKSAIVTVDFDPELKLYTYPGALSQIISNLILNSLIHGFEHQSDHCEITIKGIDQGDQCLIVYRDNGQGMSSDTMKHAFDPFYTTKLGKGGSGLGLNIVYNLVRNKLDGVISCSSQIGEGVVFEFTLSKLSAVDCEEMPD